MILPVDGIRREIDLCMDAGDFDAIEMIEGMRIVERRDSAQDEQYPLFNCFAYVFGKEKWSDLLFFCDRALPFGKKGPPGYKEVEIEEARKGDIVVYYSDCGPQHVRYWPRL